jgi:hypothetical protein
MSRRTGVALSFALAVGVAAAAVVPPAQAFVRTTTNGAPIYWTTSCTAVTIYLNPSFTLADSGNPQSSSVRDQVAKSIAAAAHAWSPGAVDCVSADGLSAHPYFEIVPSIAAEGASPAVAADGHNVLVVHTDEWPDTLEPAAIAVTSVTKKQDGRILDADIEVNAYSFVWGNFDPGNEIAIKGAVGPYDLQGAITHEFGHFLGLGHTCFGLADKQPHPSDANGIQIPDCDSPDMPVPREVHDAVMYAFVLAGEVRQRVLTADDIAGVCDIYPAARDPLDCALDRPDDGCGCAAPSGRKRMDGTALTVVALALAVALGLRRAKR